jgi:predicted transcriptional regulator
MSLVELFVEGEVASSQDLQHAFMLRVRLLKMSRQDSSRDWLRIEDPEAAKYLVKPRARRFLAPFIGRPRTVSEVAAELDVAVNAVLYRVKRMMDLGLITVARTEPRRGRSIRYYRAASDTFFAPFDVTTAISFEELFRTTLQSHHDSLLRSVMLAWAAMKPQVTWGVLVSGDEKGIGTIAVLPELRQEQLTVFFEWLVDPEGPALWDNTHPLRLALQDPKALQRELRDLQKRYAERQTSTGKVYLVKTSLAPLEVEDAS